MGAGKSLTAIAAADILIHTLKSQNIKVLIIAPKAILHNFLSQIRKHSTYTANIGHNPDIEATFTLINVESLHKLPPQPCDILILDECQGLRNPKTQKFQKVQKIVQDGRTAHVWGLSGTPKINKNSDNLTLDRLCSNPVTWINLPPDVHSQLEQALPKLIIHVYGLPTNMNDWPNQPKHIHYENWPQGLGEISDEEFDHLQHIIDHPDYIGLTKILYTRQLCSAAQTKLQFTNDLLLHPDVQAHGMLAFAEFQHTRQLLLELGFHNFTHSGQTGNITLSHRSHAQGIELTSQSHLLFLDTPWSLPMLLQAIARTRRHGCSHPEIHVHIPLLPPEFPVWNKILDKI